MTPERIELDATLGALDLTRPSLVLAACLIGTDYWPGVKGIGPKRALDLVQRLGTVDAVAQKVHVDADLLRDVCDLFLAAEVDPSLAPVCLPPQPEETVALLCGEHDFDEGRVRAAAARYAKLAQPTRQQSLFDF